MKRQVMCGCCSFMTAHLQIRIEILMKIQTEMASQRMFNLQMSHARMLLCLDDCLFSIRRPQCERRQCIALQSVFLTSVLQSVFQPLTGLLWLLMSLIFHQKNPKYRYLTNGEFSKIRFDIFVHRNIISNFCRPLNKLQIQTMYVSKIDRV